MLPCINFQLLSREFVTSDSILLSWFCFWPFGPGCFFSSPWFFTLSTLSRTSFGSFLCYFILRTHRLGSSPRSIRIKRIWAEPGWYLGLPFSFFLKKILTTYFLLSLLTVQYSYSVMSDSLWPQECSTSGFPVHHQLPEPTQNSHPLSRWCHSTISPSVDPSPPVFSLSQHQGLFQ